MKNSIITIVSCITLFAAGISGTIASVSTGSDSAFIGKEWRITSIITEPAVMDVNGDGVRDKEVIGSIQQPGVTKSIIFMADGKVVEKTRVTNNPELVVQQGTWKRSSKSSAFTWINKEGIELKGTVEKGEVKLVYEDDKLEIKYSLTLTSN